MQSTIYLDIETIPLPVSHREFMRPSAESIKMGNIKDEAKRKAKVDEAMAEFESGAWCGLDELQGQIAILGYAVDEGEYQVASLDVYTQAFPKEPEAAMLRDFWKLASESSTEVEIIGHNIKGFDAPFMIHRSWILGVKVPAFLIGDLRQYQSRHWKDTMQLWQLGNRTADYRKLEHLAAATGNPMPELGITGATFAENWKKDKEKCLAYNREDVLAVRELWRKIQG